MQTLVKPIDPGILRTYHEMQRSHGDEIAQSYLAFQQRTALALPVVPERQLPRNRVQRSKPAPPLRKQTAFDRLIQDVILAVLEPGDTPVSAQELMQAIVLETEIVQSLLARHQVALRGKCKRIKNLDDCCDSNVRRACKVLVAAGVMGVHQDSRRATYWLLAPQERHLRTTDFVVECLGSLSERYGQIIAFRPHPQRPKQQYPFVRWQNGSAPSFSSVDLLYPWRLDAATDSN